MEEINIEAEVREGKSTKKALSGARAAAKIPGVVYGGKKPAVSVALSEKDLMTARKRGGLNAILHLKLGKTTETVIIKELQRHPVTDRPVHADFQRISMTQKIEAKVPLHIIGEAPGVKLSGGILQHELRVLTIKALPAKIPQHLDVDVSALNIGDHILVKELKVPADVEVVDAPDHLVVHVTLVKIEEAAPAAAVPGAEAAAAPAEPELSAVKGKKDEEGKPLPKDAKAAPAAEKGKEPAKKEGAK